MTVSPAGPGTAPASPSPGRAVTARDLLAIRFVGDPAMSPDGRRVAFVVTTLSEERDEYLSSVWVADAAGGEPRRFTTGPRRDREPRWSPDGQRLAFVSERGPRAKAQLYVMAADGGEPTRLTDLPAGVSAPAWSPDGRALAFVARVGGEEPEPARPGGSEEPRPSRPPREIATLRYKANGEGFVHDRPTHVFVVPVDGGPPRQLTDGEWADTDPAWSPDGRWLAFVSARHEERDHDSVSDVWLVPAAGGPARRVTDGAGPVGHPAFSPDGAWLAYVGHRYPKEAGRNMRVFAVAVEGGRPRCLTGDLDRTCSPFLGSLGATWSPDGGWLTFCAEDEGTVGVFRVRAAGDAPPERVVGGARQVTGLSVARQAGRLAFTATDPVAPAELFVAGPDGRDERRLTDLNGPWRAEVALSRPEPFHYERAGHRIDGWVMRPHGCRAGRRYPALLNVHGGPHAQYGYAFFDEFQVQAGAGYAVVFTNPRGSQGYGEAFTRAVVGDWGGEDYEDVLAGLEEALRRFDFIDPQRLGVLGGSYGGYLTSWIVGHTDRFRAACSERAVNNLASMVGTSDIGHYFMAWESGFTPWENPGWYAARSPVSHAAAIRTPLLILHSEDDLRCPMEQAEQLFVALRLLRKPVRFVRFPEENHDLSRTGRPRHRLARFRLILEWFAGYLGPGDAVAG